MLTDVFAHGTSLILVLLGLLHWTLAMNLDAKQVRINGAMPLLVSCSFLCFVFGFSGEHRAFNPPHASWSLVNIGIANVPLILVITFVWVSKLRATARSH